MYAEECVRVENTPNGNICEPYCWVNNNCADISSETDLGGVVVPCYNYR